MRRKYKNVVVAILMAFGIGFAISNAYATPVNGAGQASARQDQLDQLFKNYQQAEQDYREALKARGNGEASKGIARKLRTQLFNRYAVLGKQAMELARDYPRDQVAFDAMLFSLRYGSPFINEVCIYLRQYHIRNDNLHLFFPELLQQGADYKSCEQLYVGAVRAGSTAEVRDLARWHAASLYARLVTLSSNVREFRTNVFGYLISSVWGDNSEQVPDQLINDLRAQSQRLEMLISVDPNSMRLMALSWLDGMESEHLRSSRYVISDGKIEIKKHGELKLHVDLLSDRLKSFIPGVVAADFGATNYEGEPVSFAPYRGKVILLDFWASWCEPCLANLEKNKKMMAEMKDRPFEVIAINLDEDIDLAKSFSEPLTGGFVEWHKKPNENPSIWAKLGINEIPTLVVIDHNGVIRSIPKIYGSRMEVYLNRLVHEAQRDANTAKAAVTAMK
ncbi:TlpA disulfide reductase family protein [Porticoccaceae bacterium LTM1]|nr:TlpA disulfide reductase family protein [Porticoccaceae bacterium LTM1]